ncbi:MULTISPECIES: DUF1329 domain-containing protein [Pseudomonas]|uniref:DUF1329 domain-containing protein n=1 Tax=Pseudomonas TaxID=286 RepID=UPI000D0018A1|nr:MULTISPECIES: DUF1329 domain-containing protein [Pseudomonas]PRA45866.1 hypothetical protein CQZ98_24415 [Pseudomonas sp. MYb115]QXN52274.1 DUF1329 domain-containing protein [Pseudomonas fluorescens]WSO26608.1 DUF1329 domain-containing protein [Pseudomonas fluorescens]
MNNHSVKFLLSAAFFVALINTPVRAAVTPAEAAKLNSELTPLGAERSGNASGSIPAWSGGYKGMPAGHKPGSMNSDPFPDEKPVLVINSKNAAAYKDQLSQTVQLLLQQNPEWRLDVYPTHRTASAPEAFYNYTKTNAATAQLSGDGVGVTHAYGGIPFPLPKNGSEVLWNHFLSWKGVGVEMEGGMYMVDSKGRSSLTAALKMDGFYRYALPGGEKDFDGFFQWHRSLTTAPGRSAGEALIGIWPQDFTSQQPGSWQYMPGQRRVRKLPNVQFDTPNFLMSGLTQFDEAYGFFGSPEQYDWKLVGKKEMYIPYNTNKLFSVTPEELLTPKVLNPNVIRWELHRVWEVEATLKPGVRNVVPKRRVYMDEDTWAIVMADLWDSQNKLYRGAINYPVVNYDLPGVVMRPFMSIDFQQQAYTLGELDTKYLPVTPKPRSFYSAEALVQDALR